MNFSSLLYVFACDSRCFFKKFQHLPFSFAYPIFISFVVRVDKEIDVRQRNLERVVRQLYIGGSRVIRIAFADFWYPCSICLNEL